MSDPPYTQIFTCSPEYLVTAFLGADPVFENADDRYGSGRLVRKGDSRTVPGAMPSVGAEDALPSENAITSYRGEGMPALMLVPSDWHQDYVIRSVLGAALNDYAKNTNPLEFTSAAIRTAAETPLVRSVKSGRWPTGRVYLVYSNRIDYLENLQTLVHGVARLKVSWLLRLLRSLSPSTIFGEISQSGSLVELRHKSFAKTR